MKSIDERGSSCRRPHRWSNSSPGMPLRVTRVDEEPRIALIRSRHLGPKPLLCKISNRKTQETESNALEMSNFGRIRGCFYWWRNLAVCWTRMKLSWMQRPLTNALWLAETIALSLLASQLAISLVTSLAKLWIRLIGRKSLTCTTSWFLDSRSDEVLCWEVAGSWNFHDALLQGLPSHLAWW